MLEVCECRLICSISSLKSSSNMISVRVRLMHEYKVKRDIKIEFECEDENAECD